MAQEISGARILDLEEHGRRLLEAYTEPLLDEDLAASERGRRAREAADRGLCGHLWEALEHWHRKGLPDAS